MDSHARSAAPEVMANSIDLEPFFSLNGTLHLHIPRCWEDTFLVLLIASGPAKRADDAPRRSALFPYEWAIESDERTVRKALEEAVG